MMKISRQVTNINRYLRREIPKTLLLELFKNDIPAKELKANDGESVLYTIYELQDSIKIEYERTLSKYRDQIKEIKHKPNLSKTTVDRLLRLGRKENHLIDEYTHFLKLIKRLIPVIKEDKR